jgi:hypothetical protein
MNAYAYAYAYACAYAYAISAVEADWDISKLLVLV